MYAFPKLGSVFGIPQSFTSDASNKMLPEASAAERSE